MRGNQHIYASDPNVAAQWIRKKVSESSDHVPEAVLRLVAWLDGKPKPRVIGHGGTQEKTP